MEITKYDVLGKLPDPFLFRNGERVKNTEDWVRRRKEIYDDVVNLQYGGMPPEPEFMEVSILHDGRHPGGLCSCRVTTGRKDHPVTFIMYIHFPTNFKWHTKMPAVIDGDLCFSILSDMDSIRPFTDHGIMFVKFNRLELADDFAFRKPRDEGRKGPLYECYPEYDFGALSAWAWGYSRCVDALIRLGILDESCVAFTGCSRGAKTALLAGITDTRATIVNPAETDAGGAACYRVHMSAINDEGEEKPSETLKNIWDTFEFWFGRKMKQYIDHEELLPFDCHETKALIAPRTLLVGEAENDIWGNPLGSYQTSVAAREVWKLFDKPEEIKWYWRNGNHGQKPKDFEVLSSIMRHKLDNVPYDGLLYYVPFKKPDPIWDWACPKPEGK